jgi:DNA-directed RNA polymerase specialized sigma24 family protein
VRANDVVLIRRWRTNRDGEAFAELVARYSGLVYGVCRRVTRDDGRSEVLAQECFLRLARSRPAVKGSLGPWLHRVVTNLAID